MREIFFNPDSVTVITQSPIERSTEEVEKTVEISPIAEINTIEDYESYLYRIEEKGHLGLEKEIYYILMFSRSRRNVVAKPHANVEESFYASFHYELNSQGEIEISTGSYNTELKGISPKHITKKVEGIIQEDLRKMGKINK